MQIRRTKMAATQLFQAWSGQVGQDARYEREGRGRRDIREWHSGRSEDKTAYSRVCSEDEDGRLWLQSAAKMADSSWSEGLGRRCRRKTSTPVLEAKGRKVYCMNLFVQRASSVKIGKDGMCGLGLTSIRNSRHSNLTLSAALAYLIRQEKSSGFYMGPSD
uniref:Uncharacterized protein n=1 Tax=Pipistrellus kuhlii TaxID=59472 RepID=A0A7J7XBM6_PIPKU|nr:hypothetical protein mPipKuh1_010580 [Pipistrellus kuhlii]